jgi:hypothetical protein
MKTELQNSSNAEEGVEKTSRVFVEEGIVVWRTLELSRVRRR